MTVGEKIQFYRKQKGLSQEELGKLLIVSRQTVSQWENGQTYPTVDNLMRLREVFGITVDDLVKEGEPALPETTEVPLETYNSKATPEEVNYLCYEHEAASNRILWASKGPVFLTVLLFLGMIIYVSAGLFQIVFLAFWVGYLAFAVRDCYVTRKKMLLYRAKTRAAFCDDKSTYIKVYEDHLVISIWKDGTEQASQYIRYESIESVLETRDFYIAVYKPYTLYIRKEELAPHSLLKPVLEGKLAELQKSRLTLDQTVCNLWLYGSAIAIAVAGAAFLPKIIAAFSLPKAAYWLDTLILCFPLYVLGRFAFLRIKGYKSVGRMLVYLVLLPVVYVGVRFFPGGWLTEEKPAPVVFDTNAEYVQRAEHITELELPKNYYLSVSAANEVYDGIYYYWEALLEYWELEEVTAFVHEDSHWIDTESGIMGRVYPDWAPGDEEVWDRAAVYNIDTGEWNTVPAHEETYHYIAFLWYQSGEMLLIVEYEK